MSNLDLPERMSWRSYLDFWRSLWWYVLQKKTTSVIGASESDVPKAEISYQYWCWKCLRSCSFEVMEVHDINVRTEYMNYVARLCQKFWPLEDLYMIHVRSNDDWRLKWYPKEKWQWEWEFWRLVYLMNPSFLSYSKLKVCVEMKVLLSQFYMLCFIQDVLSK